MTTNAIEIHDLGKKYRIANLQKRRDTLAGTLIQSFTGPFRRLRNLAAGNMTGAAELDRDFWALRNITFDVAHGETVGVIGQNGAGKSTLLKILSRITDPSEGHATINGRVGSLLEVGTGFNLELTGRENIYLNGSILGMTTAEIESKFDEIISFAGVENFIDTPVKHYSSGMGVRLAFAVAAHLEPEILLIDEVLAVGDYAFQKKSLGKMQDVTRSGRTVLFVSHQLDMVREICDRVILLEEGRIKMTGPTNDVVDAYIDGFAEQALATGSFTCPVEPERPFQILGGRLVGRTGSAGPYDVFDPITIEVEYEVREPMVGGILNFILKQTGLRLATSFDTDTNPERLERREPGRYKSVVTLPLPMLKAGTYTLDFTLGYVRDRNMNRHRVENALTFDVSLLSRPGTFLSFDAKRDGKVALALDWQESRIGETAGMPQ